MKIVCLLHSLLKAIHQLRISAKRSPMITHGAWVLPVVMVGMIEPSATLDAVATRGA
jgi:hypothetical protein